jgi:predicted secreted protein
MTSREQSLHDRLADARGSRVVFVSHCVLDENVRYLGGAFHRGAIPEAADLLRSGVGICQMPCPERLAWGGVQKPMMLRSYGLRDTPLYRFRHVLLRLFLFSTRLRYRILARQVVREIEQYRDAQVEVVGLVGIGASPSCGVRTTLDVGRSFETLAGCPLARIDRRFVNERVVAGCRTPGEGLFVAALRKRLRRRQVDVSFFEYDLISEMRGLRQWPFPVASVVKRNGASVIP